MTEQKKNNAFVVISIIFIIFSCFGWISKCNSNKQDSIQAKLNDPYYIPDNILLEYKDISKSRYPSQHDSIVQIWDMIRSSSVDPFDKIDLVSSDYKRRFRSVLKSALTLPVEEFRLLEIQYRIDVLKFRQELLQVFTREEINNKTYEDILPEFFYVELGAFSIKSKIDKVKFESDSLAYGLFKVYGNYKSVEFVRESDSWKVNMFREDPAFDGQRQNLINQRIKEFGSADKYFEFLMEGNLELKFPLQEN